MRDLLLTLIIFGSLPVILTRPFIGVVMWTWISFMNPHKLVWSYAADLHPAMLVGVATIIGLVFSREPKKIPWDTISVLMLIYVLWTGITTILALEPDMAQVKWLQFNKTILMVFLTLILMRSPERIRLLIWVTVVSVGYYTVKGGYFTIISGGEWRVFGPAGTAYGDNNNFALAAVMIIPLMHYLASTTANRWVRYGLYGAIALSFTAVIGTYSRGGLLGLGVMLIVYWWQARQKWMLAGALVLAIMFALPLLPQKWFDRMETIQTYEQDASATSRLEMWGFALELVEKRPVVGGGFNVFQGSRAYELVGSDVARRNIHSLYFEALGEHGVVGLILFMLLGISAFRAAAWIARHTRGQPELAAEHDLGRMLTVSLIAYAAVGAFINVAHFDLYFHMLAILLLAKLNLVDRLQTEPATEIDGGAAGADPPLAGGSAAARPVSFLRRNAKQGSGRFGVRPNLR